jgi:hypothetical protein
MEDFNFIKLLAIGITTLYRKKMSNQKYLFLNFLSAIFYFLTGWQRSKKLRVGKQAHIVKDFIVCWMPYKGFKVSSHLISSVDLFLSVLKISTESSLC